MTASGRMFLDATGPYLPYGASFFWALWGWKFDRDRMKQNAEYLAGTLHAQFVRIFAAVSGGSWDDRACGLEWPDYREQARGMLEYLQSLGLRVEPTLVAGPADVLAMVEAWTEITRGKEDAIQHYETVNEFYAWLGAPGPTQMRTAGRRLRDQTPNLVALSSPEWDPAIVDRWVQEGVANLATVHPDRKSSTFEGSQRQCRQSWDFRDLRCPGSLDEPGGVQSSLAQLTDPTQIAMQRAIAALCGLGSYVLHCGAGIRGGGAGDAPSKTHPWERSANFFDPPPAGQDFDLPAIARAIEGTTALLPPDLPNWQKFNNKWGPDDHPPGHPFPAPPERVDNRSVGVIRNFGAISGNRFVSLPLGIMGVGWFTPLRACVVRVHDPATGALLQEHAVGAGEQVRIAGNDEGTTSVIVLGEFL